jgi:Right handed beta helix region
MRFQRQQVTTIVLALMVTPLLEATSSHTWVAGNGNDGNPCTFSQPCATFQVAHTNTTAGGIVSVLSPGDFGPITISKAITIDGGGLGGSITFTGGEGIYITAGTADTVILRHLTINGLNTGQDAIYLSQALNLLIEDCDLENFVSIGLGVQSLSANSIVVRNTRIVGGQLGVRTFQSSGMVPYDIISMRNVTISGATSAAVFSRNGQLEISDSVITQSAIGLEADTNAFINVANSVISYNATDEEFFPNTTGGIFLSNNNTFFGNNATAGPPSGPSSVVNSQAVVRTGKNPPPPDPPRHRHQ